VILRLSTGSKGTLRNEGKRGSVWSYGAPLDVEEREQMLRVLSTYMPGR
jgi:hypothetical protein